jgi:hypothetical protein
MKAKHNDIIMQNKIFSWLAFLVGILLLVPLITMQFSSEVNWSVLDFLTAGILLFGLGSLYVLTARKFQQRNRVVLAGIFVAVLAYLWIELAVGIFFHWGN